MADPDLRALIAVLAQQVSARLHVPLRPLRVERAPGAYVACTTLTWPPDPGIVRLSHDVAAVPGLLAHELTHALVPTSWLFFAEGLATWMGCEVTGSCADYSFVEGDPDQVVAHFRAELPPLAALMHESTRHAVLLAPESVHRLEVRLAHVLAASFLRWFCTRYPELPARVGVRSCMKPDHELERLAGHSLAELESKWQRHVHAGAPSTVFA